MAHHQGENNLRFEIYNLHSPTLVQRARIYLTAIAFCLAIIYIHICNANYAAAEDTAEPKILERTIKIQGTVEKPRVIFIVPRTKLWKSEVMKKRFINDILQPVYPEFLSR